MATVRLHTQHHSAGGLRPATPTCCCCSCCCVGAAAGTLTILPVMILRAAIAQPERASIPHATISQEVPGEVVEESPDRARPKSANGLGAWGEGIAAFAVALVPIPYLFLIRPEGLGLIAVIFVILALALMAWAMIRTNRAGRPIWPPLVSVLVVLPIAFLVEFYNGAELLTGDSTGYWVLATTIGAIVFGIGLVFTLFARRS